MSLTPDELAQGDRLAETYNERPFNAQTNPGGFGRGGNSAIGLFIKSLRDMVGFGRGVVRVATAALAEIARIADEAKLALLIVEGGPVSSVTVGGVTQTGAVTIDLSSISEPVQQQLAEIQAVQAELEASTAALSSDAAAYANAFGG